MFGSRRKRPVLTEGSVGLHLIRLALPMVVGVLAMMAFNIVDTYFVGKLGTLPLAAMATTFPLVMIVFSLSLGLSVSTSIAVSRAIGQQDIMRVRRLTTDALSFGLLLSFVLSVIGLFTLDPALHVISGGLATHALARSYMQIWYAGLVAVVLPSVANMAIRATGDTVTPSVLMVAGVVINAILDPIMIFGFGPIPRMEIQGAAWATVISRGITLIASLHILRVRKRMVTLPFVSLRVIFDSWMLLLRTAVPVAINNLITPLIAGAVTRLTAAIGATAVAGFGIVTRVENLGLTSIFALQAVVGLFIAQNVGAGKWDRVRHGARCTELFALGWGVGLYLLLLLFGRRIAVLFDADEMVVIVTMTYFLIAGAGFAFRAVYLVSSASLNALNYAPTATLLTVLQGVVLTIPIAWLASRYFGVAGVFAGIGIANIVTGLATSLGLRRAIHVEEESTSRHARDQRKE